MALNLLFKLTEDVAEKWITKSGDHIPIHQYMLALALKSVALMLFGEYFADDEICFQFAQNYETCWNLMEEQISNFGAPITEEQQSAFNKALLSMHNTLKLIIKNRRENPADANRLFVDQLIDLCADAKQSNKSSDDQLLFDVAITYMVGGFHTTGNLLAWLIYYLAQNEGVEERLFEELVRELGPTEPVNERSIKNLVYTRQVIDETLRVSTLAPIAARVFSHDTELGGFTIPKDTPIIQAIGVASLDDQLWEDPELFDPSRFDGNEGGNDNLGLDAPVFGFAGKRICPGRRLAYVEAQVIISVLCRRFKFVLVDPEIEIEPVYGLVTKPAEEIYVYAKKR